MSLTPLLGVVLGISLWSGVPTPQDPGYLVEGRVLHEDASGGLQDVTVELIGPGSSSGVFAAGKTRGNGEFRFAGVRPGGYTVRVLRNGFLPRAQYVHVDEDLAVILSMAPVDAGSGSGFSGPTDRSGKSSGPVPATAAAGSVSGSTITLTGVIRDARWGLPLSGIDVLTSDGRAIQSGSFGTLRLEAVSRDRPLLLRVHAFGYLPLDTVLTFRRDSTLDPRPDSRIDLQLTPDPAVQRRIDSEVAILKRRSEGRPELVGVLNREALLAFHAPTLAAGIRAAYPDRAGRIACVVVDDASARPRSELAMHRPGDLQRVELLRRSGNPDALVARLHTRDFVRDLVAGAVEANRRAFDYLHSAGRGSEDSAHGATCPV